MSWRRAAVVVVVAGVGLLLGHSSGRPAASAPAPPVAPLRVDPSADRPLVAYAPAAAAPAPAPTFQASPDRLHPALGREHRRMLADRPILQRLPYRDREIGVGLDRVLGDGRLELLVTYLGSRARAAGDLRRLLARYGDPGTAYVERYERVF